MKVNLSSFLDVLKSSGFEFFLMILFLVSIAASFSTSALAGEEILLKSRNIEPGEQKELALSSLSQEEGGNYVIIQFSDIPSNQKRHNLKRRGVRLLSYIPEKAWIAYTPARKIEWLRKKRGISVIDELRSEDRISPSLVDILPENESKEINVSVSFFNTINPAEERKIIDKYGGGFKEGKRGVWKLELNEKEVYDLASHGPVQWMYPTTRMVTHNQNSRELIEVNSVQDAPFNLSGQGFTAAEWDGGWAGNHSDLNYSGKIHVGDKGAECGDCKVKEHGTHVAGTMLGNGTLNNSLRGMAPDASLATYEYPDIGDTEELVNETNHSVVQFDSVISQNSWGWSTLLTPSIVGNYEGLSIDYDNITHGSSNVRKPISFVFSAGNEGGNYERRFNTTTGPGGTAKNTITVGALKDNGEMSDFSSWGPTDDGRIKPDLVANGVNVKSTILDNDYGFQSGTSMAAPAVSGVALLLYEQFNKTLEVEPKPATIKSVLIHTAEDLNTTGPDFPTGWGRVDAKEAAEYVRKEPSLNRTINASLGDGERDNYTFISLPGQDSFKATLVWSDYPASPNPSKALVNDLDLEVRDKDSNRKFPWTLPGFSNLSKAAVRDKEDHTNNVEQVYVENPSHNQWQISIEGDTVAHPEQSYTLVSNAMTVDESSAPNIFHESPLNKSHSGNISFNVTVDESLDEALFSVDGGENISMQNDTRYHYFNSSSTSLSEGDHDVTFYVKDLDGNWNSSTVDFRIDTTPPDWRNQMQNASSSERGESLSFSAQGRDSSNLSHGMLSTNESGEWVNKTGVYGSPIRFFSKNTWEWSNFTWRNESFVGDFRWKIWYNDTAGNWNSTDVLSVNVTDFDPPNPVINNPPNDTIVDRSPLLEVTADEPVEWKYSLDSGLNKTFEPNITLPLLSEGSHNLTVWANDSAELVNSTTVYFRVGFINSESGEGEWKMFRRFLNHNGSTGSDAPSNISTATVEEFSAGSAFRSSPAVVNGSVYVGVNNGSIFDPSGFVYRLNASNVSEMFGKFVVEDWVESSPSVANGSVYVGSDNGYVYQLNASNLTEVLGNFSTDSFVDSSPAVSAGSVYVGVDNGSIFNPSGVVYRLNASNVSEKLGLFSTGGGVSSSPAVSKSFVYVGSNDGNLYQLDPSISESIASFDTGDSVQSSPAVSNGFVYVGSDNESLHQLNASNVSEEISRFGLHGEFRSSPAIVNGSVYVGVNNDSISGVVYRLNASNVSEMFGKFVVDEWVESSPSVAKGSVYVGSDNGYVYQLNASNVSQRIGKFSTGGLVRSSPAIWNGSLYIGSDDGRLYSFEDDSEPPEMNFRGPTPANNTNQTKLEANVTAKDQNIRNVTISVYNATGSILGNNTTRQSPNFETFKLEKGDYWYNATAYDEVGRSETETRKVSIDRAPDWRRQRQNVTVVPNESAIELSAQAKDFINLTYGMLSTNESGEWVNKTGVYGSPVRFFSSNKWNWSNFTWKNDSVLGGVGWKVWYNDSVGNWNSTDIKMFRVDEEPPRITIHRPRETNLSDSSPDLEVTADENISTWRYNVDTGSNTTFSPNTTLSGLEDGTHNITVWANDTVDNWNRSTTDFKIDTTVPNISFRPPTPSNNSELGSNLLEVNVSASDNQLENITIYVYNSTGSSTSIVNNTTTASSPNFLNVSLSDGDYMFNASTYDVAGNRNETATRSVTLGADPGSNPSDNDDDEPDGGGAGSTDQQSKLFDIIEPGETAVMEIDDPGRFGVNNITLSVTKNSSLVEITVKRQEGRPEDVGEPGDEVYRYLNIGASNINDSRIEEARIDFSVNKSWINDINSNKSRVALKRYKDGNWNDLETKVDSEEDKKVKYSSSGPGLSYFAVVASPLPKKTVDVEQNQQEEEDSDQGPVCGDNQCEGSEDWASCQQDCSKPEDVLELESTIEELEKQFEEGERGFELLQNAQDSLSRGNVSGARSLVEKAKNSGGGGYLIYFIVIFLIILAGASVLVYLSMSGGSARGVSRGIDRRERLGKRINELLMDIGEMEAEEYLEKNLSERVERAQDLVDEGEFKEAQRLIEEIEGDVRSRGRR